MKTISSPFIGHRLKNARVELRLTQVQLAHKADMKQKAISNYENGKVEPTLSTLCKLAMILKKPYIYFLDTSFAWSYYEKR